MGICILMVCLIAYGAWSLLTALWPLLIVVAVGLIISIHRQRSSLQDQTAGNLPAECQSN